MPDYYERYGFGSSPFRLRVLSIEGSDPLVAQAKAEGVLLDIDGFSMLAATEAYLRKRVDSGKPAFVLIIGREKSGLTSAAAAVLLNYREARTLAASRFVPISVTASDHSELQLYKRLMAAMNAKLPPRLVALTDEVKGRLKGATKFDDKDTLDYDLQGVIDELLPALKANPETSFGVALEAIKTSRPIDIARVAFENAATVCAFTCQPGVVDAQAFKEKNPDVHVLELGHLKAPEVRRVLETRWGTASNLPFHTDTFCDKCEQHQHPIGVVLTLADGMLKKRVTHYEELNRTGTWPADPELGVPNPLDTLSLFEFVMYGGS